MINDPISAHCGDQFLHGVHPQCSGWVLGTTDKQNFRIWSQRDLCSEPDSDTCWLCDLVQVIWPSLLSFSSVKWKEYQYLPGTIVIRIKKYNAYKSLRGLGHYMHCNIFAMFAILLFHSVYSPESIHRKHRNWMIFKM